MPNAGAPTANHPARGAGSKPAPHRLPEQPDRSNPSSRNTPDATRQRPNSDLAKQQPAHHGLTLPRITAPNSFTLNPDKSRNAELALALLNHGVIKSSDFDTQKPIPIAIGEALAAAITPDKAVTLHLSTHLQRQENQLRLYVVPELDTNNYLNAHALINSLDQLDINLAPSLMKLIRRAHALIPCFTPVDAYETIIQLHWYGDETGEEAFEMYRDDYCAMEHNIPWQEVTPEQLREYARQAGVLMPEHIEDRLPRRYYNNHGKAPELLDKLSGSLFPGALGDIQALINACTEAEQHSESVLHHPLTNWGNDELNESTVPWYAYMIGITAPNDDPTRPHNEFHDVVFEALYEYETYTLESGLEPGPSGSYLIPETPEGMQQLADLITKTKHQITLESRIYDTLKALINNQRP